MEASTAGLEPAEQTQQAEPIEAQVPVTYERVQEPEATDETPEPEAPAVEPPVAQSGRITLHSGLSKDVVNISLVDAAFRNADLREAALELEDPGGRKFTVRVSEIALYE